MSNSLTIKAYAKINLFLEINSIMNNGYHEIKSIMQSVNLFDLVTIHKTDKNFITVSTSDPSIPENENNIAHKAASSLLEFVGLPLSNLEIIIKKNIPHQAGLAGGSADAAAVLVGINELLKLGLSVNQLSQIGAGVGADVPFCISGGTALTEGIGEVITPIEKLSALKLWIVIVKPDAGISTLEAFKKYDKIVLLEEQKRDVSTVLDAISQQNISLIGNNLYNVFERVTATGETDLIKSIMLSSGANGAVMSGTGSSVIGIFEDYQVAKNCQMVLQLNYSDVFLTTPVDAGVEF